MKTVGNNDKKTFISENHWKAVFETELHKFDIRRMLLLSMANIFVFTVVYDNNTIIDFEALSTVLQMMFYIFISI